MDKDAQEKIATIISNGVAYHQGSFPMATQILNELRTLGYRKLPEDRLPDDDIIDDGFLLRLIFKVKQILNGGVMSKKKGLTEFLEVYDITCDVGWQSLDLAQNLLFKFEVVKPEYNKVEKGDVRLAYALVGSSLMEAIHKLAKALGYTREDYVENADKRARARKR